YGDVHDATVPLARTQIQEIAKIPGGTLLEVYSRDQLLAVLPTDRSNISAFFTFLHGCSGVRLRAEETDLVKEKSALPPRLLFRPDSFVTSDELQRLRDKLCAEERRIPYLSSRPIIILNACDTGPSTVRTSAWQLREVLFRLGARAIITTETPVWDYFGHHFSMLLIGRLKDGKYLSDSVTETRRFFLSQSNNPLGLLYAYYGSPSAT